VGVACPVIVAGGVDSSATVGFESGRAGAVEVVGMVDSSKPVATQPVRVRHIRIISNNFIFFLLCGFSVSYRFCIEKALFLLTCLAYQKKVREVLGRCKRNVRIQNGKSAEYFCKHYRFCRFRGWLLSPVKDTTILNNADFCILEVDRGEADGV
jgi:hypothetical protein